MLVLDSSALFSMEQLPEEESVCPPGVVRELAKYNDHRLDLWGDLLRISDCSEASVKKVEEEARKSGHKEGYDDGFLRGQQEAKAEYDDKMASLEEVKAQVEKDAQETRRLMKNL